jgi:6-pyruvoyltetrahydropterin/6-carboxytetrahydropterin synthase
MPFAITTTLGFHAGHQLRLYDGSLEDLHEHDWQIKVTIEAPKLDSIGVVMDFHDLSRRVEAVLSPFHGRRLNDLPVFADDNPSAENVALHIGRALELPPGVRLTAVEVWETPENSAIYQP